MLAVEIGERIRTPKTTLLRAGELEKRVRLAIAKTGPGGAVFVLVDADDPPYVTPGDLAIRLAAVCQNVPYGTAVAVREYESWLIAGVEGLYGKRGFSDGVEPPSDPEAVRGAKGWLSRHMPTAHPYAPTLHQAAFTAAFDMEKARARSPSFDLCYREIARLVTISARKTS
jgi:hypothetical protein